MCVVELAVNAVLEAYGETSDVWAMKQLMVHAKARERAALDS